MHPEQAIRAALERGDLVRAATCGLEAYGADTRRMLGALVRDDGVAREAFGQCCEDLWRGLPGFRGDCSFRSWLLTLARHAAFRVLRRERAQRRLAQALAREGWLPREPLDDRVRRERALDELRRSLRPEDQLLLDLRVDRELSWREIGRRVPGGDVVARKRFERLKKRLAERARAA